MKLWEDGLFDLDDDVSEALGFSLRSPHFPNKTISYRMLLSHTSSILEGSGYDAFISDTYTKDTIPTVEELLTPTGKYYSANIWSSREPGTYFTYSNVNFGLIGTLIEVLSGLRFDVYERLHVLAPLNISGSYNIHDISDINKVAVIYRNDIPQADNFKGVMPSQRNLSSYKIGTNGFIFGAQGGLRASLRELSHILLLIQSQGKWNGQRQLHVETVRQMTAASWTNDGKNG
jgi:CubicO group peptidase (beta-lactamase class C family)